MITFPMTKSYNVPVFLRLYMLFANEGWDYSGTLPDSVMMSQQTRSFGPIADLKIALELVEDKSFW